MWQRSSIVNNLISKPMEITKEKSLPELERELSELRIIQGKIEKGVHYSMYTLGTIKEAIRGVESELDNLSQ